MTKHLELEERSLYWRTSFLQHQSGETAYCYAIRVPEHARDRAGLSGGSTSFLGSILYGTRI